MVYGQTFSFIQSFQIIIIIESLIICIEDEDEKKVGVGWFIQIETNIFPMNYTVFFRINSPKQGKVKKK